MPQTDNKPSHWKRHTLLSVDFETERPRHFCCHSVVIKLLRQHIWRTRTFLQSAIRSNQPVTLSELYVLPAAVKMRDLIPHCHSHWRPKANKLVSFRQSCLNEAMANGSKKLFLLHNTAVILLRKDSTKFIRFYTSLHRRIQRQQRSSKGNGIIRIYTVAASKGLRGDHARRLSLSR
eukprot:6205998-Pleurochrysis_carterae.AAC.1